MASLSKLTPSCVVSSTQARAWSPAWAKASTIAWPIQGGCGLGRVKITAQLDGQTVDVARLDNSSNAAIDTSPATSEPCVAAIYQLDSLVRRASSLQLTADGRAAQGANA